MKTAEMMAELRSFAEDHPEGWGHVEWEGLLERLANAGFDVSDCDRVGLDLERTRLCQTLKRMQVRGLGTKRIEAIASHFGTVWNLKHASPEEVSQLPNIPRSIAGEILATLQ
jgi:hypothetical protein